MKTTAPLLIFVAAILAIPAGLSRLFPAKARFDSKPLAQLQASNPDVVMISDSMLDKSVDPKLMGELLGGIRVELLWYGSSASASWYFRLKNYVIASGIRPRFVCIFFRDQMLTSPAFRTTGTYRYKLEAAMHEDEPVYQLVLGDPEKQNLEGLINRVYPLNARRHVQREKIERMLLRGLADLGTNVTVLQAQLNETFAIEHLRGGATEEAAALSMKKEMDFDPDPRRSFLPHMVQVAAAARIPLCFIRVRRYPGPDGYVPQSERLRKYITDLHTWLEARSCYFIDDTDNLKRTSDMFYQPGDDHMGLSATRRSTELYAEELRSLLSQ